MSSVALLGLAREVIGVDASVDMLRLARRAARIHYVASSAEVMPFRAGRFDLIAACGAMDWVDRARFMPQAVELLASGGWLIPLDFGDRGRSTAIPGLERWYEDVFQKVYPRPPARDPLITTKEAASHGFSEPVNHDFASSCWFTAPQYSAFLMTESNVIAAIEYGSRPADEVRAWLEGELAPLFEGDSREVAFGGYIQILRKL
jgi:SAM-dependent methyltransferase